MQNKKCEHCVDEICTNADCPYVADYCPVTDTPNVCSFDTRPEDGTYLCIYELYNYATNSIKKRYGIGYRKNGRWYGEVSNAPCSRVLKYKKLADVEEVIDL